MVSEGFALVERPVACEGRGQYMAVVHYGSPGGDLYEHVFKYSHKDPRAKGEAAVLGDITHEVPARYRRFIIAISVVKRCLHPKRPEVANVARAPYFERVYSWVIEHDSAIQQAFDQREGRRLEALLLARAITLPYTRHELRVLPVTDVVITNFWQHAHASLGLRGIERKVALRSLLASA